MSNDVKYTVWTGSAHEIIKHCDERIDAYFADLKAKQEKQFKREQEHWKRLEKLIAALTRRKK